MAVIIYKVLKTWVKFVTFLAIQSCVNLLLCLAIQSCVKFFTLMFFFCLCWFLVCMLLRYCRKKLHGGLRMNLSLRLSSGARAQSAFLRC